MRPLRTIAVIASLVTTLTACGDSLGPADTDQKTDQAARLAHYRQVWTAAGVKDYRMTIKISGAWVGGRAEIEVRNSVPVSLKSLDHPIVQGQSTIFEYYDTVEELFAAVQRGIDHQVDRLEVNYDRRYGVPVSAVIDVIQMADDELAFTVEEFRVLR